MYFLYVDESGDTGSKAGASRHFILCGLLIHHSNWQAVSLDAKAMRQRLTQQFGLPAEAELHASEFLSKNSNQYRLPLTARIRCALHAVGFVRKHPRLRPLRVIIEKEFSVPDLTYAMAWKQLVEAALQHISSTSQQCPAVGIIVICDDHRTAPKHELIRPILNQHPGAIIDLPFGLDSQDSDFLQLADLSAFLTKQTLSPSSTFQGGHALPLLRRNADLYDDA
jgi:hypothetical protein